MLKQGSGVIVNIASVQGRQSMKGVPAYAASKGGMISLTQQLAMDYSEQNIRVLAVNPGTIETSLALGEREPRRRGTPVCRSRRPPHVGRIGQT